MLTRGISPRAWLRAGLLLVALPGCRDSATTTEPEARCRRDADCRQGQVCQGGACVNPADEAVVESPGATRAAAAFADASPGPAWRRGGPGLPHPATASGPRTAPTVAWELSLGAAISASPRLVTVEEEVLACVGAHQGRFVCAVVEGPRAGTVALELQLDGVVWGTAAVGPGPGDEARLYVGTDADTLHAIDVGTGAVVWSTRLGRCDPPRALGPMGVRCDVDGGPTVAVDGALVVGADGVYRVERDGAIAWRFDGAPADASAEDGADGAVAEGGAEDGADGATDGDEPTEAATSKKKSTKKKSTKNKSTKKKSTKKKSTKKTSTKNKKTGSKDQEAAEDLPPTKIEHVYAAPVITPRGDIVVGTQGAGLIAVDPEGRERWRVELVGDVDSAPAVGGDGTLYVGDDGGRLVAVGANGQLRWTALLGAPVRAAVAIDPRIPAGRRRAPTERVYVSTLAGNVYAFTRAGELLWTLELGAPIQSTPVLDAEGTLFFGAQDERLYAVTREGDVRWRIELPADVDSSVAISPGGRLVFGADDGMLRAVADPTAPVDR